MFTWLGISGNIEIKYLYHFKVYFPLLETLHANFLSAFYLKVNTVEWRSVLVNRSFSYSKVSFFLILAKFNKT